MGNINITKSLKKQGIRPKVDHEAVVVDNKDPDKLGRVKVRVKELHQGIKDEHLPWCIPKFAHVNGAKGGDEFSRSGILSVPKKDTKVLVEFQDGDPHYPVWKGYTIDDKTKLKEANKNYPDRTVVRFSNGSMLIVDTKSHEMFIHNPGDTYLIVQGDLHQQVYGDSQDTTHSSKNKAIDPYFTNDKELPIGEAKQSQTKSVEFKGNGKKGSGNRHIEVGGDYTITVEGDRIVKIKGDDKLTIEGDCITTIEGNYTVTAKGDGKISTQASLTLETQGELKLIGSIINLN